MGDQGEGASTPPTPRRRSMVLPEAGIAFVLAVAVSAVVFAPQTESPGPGAVVTGDVPEHSLGEILTLPPIDLATMEWLDRMQTAVASDPDYGTVAISEDRLTVTVTWFDEPSDTLHAFIDEAPTPIVVMIQPAAFRPIELKELATRAVSTPALVPGVQVAMGAMENDGSGIMVGIVELPPGRSLTDVGTEFASALGRADVPVNVEVSGEIVPISG
ncbi:MAG TPA: hypothetical protein VEX88_14785 [Glaciibacter sp.]|nr:hypothetical protein [Glaciibacter sp.]